MPPIHMTRDERATLARLAESATPVNELPAAHAEKLVSHGLAVRDAMRISITPKGQLELFRQRFRKQTTRWGRHPMNGLVLGEALRQAVPDPLELPNADNDAGLDQRPKGIDDTDSD